MYRINYEQGNGYNCGCCRQTSNESIDFETKDEVIQFLSRIEALNKNSKIRDWQDEEDRCVEEIIEIIPKDLTNQFSHDDKIVQGILDKYENKNKIKARFKKIKKLIKD